MAKSNITTLAHLTEVVMWCSLGPIVAPMVKTQNKFTGVRAQTIPDESDVQVPVQHDFSVTFERNKIRQKIC